MGDLEQSYRAAGNQLTDWGNHPISRGSRVFIEFLWPRRLLSQYLLWTMVLQTSSKLDPGCWILNHFYWYWIFLQPFGGWCGPKTAIASYFLFGMRLCWPSVPLMWHHLFQVQCWGQQSLFKPGGPSCFRSACRHSRDIFCCFNASMHLLGINRNLNSSCHSR